MDKYTFYIDFEAISPPHFYKLNFSNPLNCLPFCYTIGYYDKDKHFNIRFKILDFTKATIKNWAKYLKSDIAKHIYELIDKKIEINSDNVTFIGWNPVLENSVTKYLFDIPTLPLINSGVISLDSITQNSKYAKNEYFSYFKNLDFQDKYYISAIDTNKNGLIASYIGFLLYCAAKRKYFKNDYIFKNCNLSYIVNELAQYNKDDVLKMDFIIRNYDVIHSKVSNIETLRKKITNFSAKINQLKSFNTQIKKYISVSDKYMDDLTIKITIEKTNLINKIDNLKSVNNNFEVLKLKGEIKRINKIQSLIYKYSLKYTTIKEYFAFCNNKIDQLEKSKQQVKKQIDLILKGDK
ncbi:hypothetical protein V2E24_03480 [Mycoplasmopsis ciconiae]|uniref:DUF2779 domain-containing protein n=1 Tax=Mycoplasmopsis ciconiae TaxID=561067 RepID=A0ABU7MM94_9BACT|nr:hypothetical protein [Mycoplasmopsis ciconiae]